VIVWITGRPAAGKTTVATAVVARLQALGRPAQLLDGDILRQGTSRDLGFSRTDRDEQVRRAAIAARELAAAGVVAVVALVSPFSMGRRQARDLCAPHVFFEVHLDTPIDVAEARDAKGLYLRARRGEIGDFTGIDSPYEPPANPDLRLDGAGTAPEALCEQVLGLLRHQW
jgi:adenylylsulfate kinase